MLWYFFGIVFILSSFIGLAQYGFGNFIICLLIGGFLILNGVIKNKDKKNEKSSKSIDLNKSDSVVNEKCKTITAYVTGVTFNNDSGRLRSRQSILRKIYFSDPPFDCEHIVALERYLYNGEPAYYVKVNDYIIGNIQKEMVTYIEENSNREYEIQDFEIYGGQKGKNFGAMLKIVYLDTLQ